MEYDIDRLHSVLIEILDYFVSVCKKNNLKYFLVYGTALGAYRHKGFIPWDDDLDVAMPREDYERFLKIMRDNPNKNYTLQNQDDEEKWFLSFSKIRKNGTAFIESIAQDTYQNNGIYIDVFPLDYVGEKNKFVREIEKKTIGYLRHSLKFCACRKLYREKYTNVRYSVENILTLPVQIMGCSKSLGVMNRKRIGKCLAKDATFIAEYDDPHALEIPMDVYFPAKKIEFEGKEYCAPHEIEKYLSIIYGKNYMELPPLEERRTHQPYKIVF